MDIVNMLNQVEGTGVYLLETSKSLTVIESVIQNLDYTFLRINGEQIHSKEDLFRLIKGILGVPDYLGESWDSFYDILTGFDWEPQNDKGYIILYDNFHHFAESNATDFHLVLSYFQEAAKTTEENRKLYILLKGKLEMIPKEFSRAKKVRI